MRSQWKNSTALGTAVLWYGLSHTSVWAAGVGWPWDQPLNTFTLALTGAPAYFITALGILLTGVTWAHTHHGVGVMKGTATLAGGAIAIKALDVMGLLGWTAAGALF
jgi:type IV secretory pathway VirB2 component (pilin)